MKIQNGHEMYKECMVYIKAMQEKKEDQSVIAAQEAAIHELQELAVRLMRKGRREL